MRNRPVYDVVALLARCGVGAVFVAHGWQKIQVGITTTGRSMDVLGVPFPTTAAVFATFVELLGGVALIVGVALPIAGALLFLDMAGAVAFVNGRHGIFLVDSGKVHNGFELALLLGLASLLFATGGAGRLTLDRRIFGSRGSGSDEDDDDAFVLPPEREVPYPPSATSEIGPAPIGPEDTQPTRRPSDLVTDTSNDVVVAGKKTTDDTTTPTKSRKRPPRSHT